MITMRGVRVFGMVLTQELGVKEEENFVPSFFCDGRFEVLYHVLWKRVCVVSCYVCGMSFSCGCVFSVMCNMRFLGDEALGERGCDVMGWMGMGCKYNI